MAEQQPGIPDNEVKMYSLFIKELSEHVKELSTAVQKMTGEAHTQTLIITTIQTELEALKVCHQEVNNQSHALQAIQTDSEVVKENQKQLLKVVRDGNGTPSLITRTAILEESLTNHLKDYKDVLAGQKDGLIRVTQLEDGLKNIREVKEDRLQANRHRWQIYAAIISGILGMLGGAFALFHH